MRVEKFSGLALFLLAVVVSMGTLWAFGRGGKDFYVFYEAWSLVLRGHGELIYQVSPDRFLYAPAFAWLLSPLALLPKTASLGLWCFVKAVFLGKMIQKFARHLAVPSGVVAMGVLFLARPLLIDFEYGQVNTFILVLCSWATLRHFEFEENAKYDFLSWFGLTFAAFAKIFPLPLLFIPWLFSNIPNKKRIRRERIAVIAGLVIVSVTPLIALGWSGGLDVYRGWAQALLDRGTPIESHNQSFVALLRHYLSGEPTPILAQGMRSTLFGFALLSQEAIGWIASVWTVSGMAFIFFWILRGRAMSPMLWMSILLGLLIVPSHLVWKPYFVMSIPAAIVALSSAFYGTPSGRWPRWALWSLGFLFVAINFTTFNFVGSNLSARLEAASTLLVLHLALLLLLGMSPRFGKFGH